MRVLITGGNGQLGRALKLVFKDSVATDVTELDITNSEAVNSFDWNGIEAIINAAAFTNVDGAELPENKDIVQAVNVTGVGNLAQAAKDHNIPFVHISTEYVFDGKKDGPYKEEDPTSPLSVYGKSKAQAEETAKIAPKYFVVRTTSLIGDGHNFVRIMLSLAKKGINPSVVNDQICRLTFSDTLAQGISHLLTTNSPYGTYHLTNGGKPASWAEIARLIFKIAGMNNEVTEVSTEDYFKSKENVAHRPRNSVLNLEKAHKVGIITPDWREELKKYIKENV